MVRETVCCHGITEEMKIKVIINQETFHFSVHLLYTFIHIYSLVLVIIVLLSSIISSELRTLENRVFPFIGGLTEKFIVNRNISPHTKLYLQYIQVQSAPKTSTYIFMIVSVALL